MLSLWWFDFSLDERGEGETFELELAFEFDEFNSSVLLWCSLLELQWTDVLEFGRECGASAMGLRRLSLCRMELSGEPASSFFGVFGRVSANACVCKLRTKWELLTSFGAPTDWIELDALATDLFLECRQMEINLCGFKCKRQEHARQRENVKVFLLRNAHTRANRASWLLLNLWLLHFNASIEWFMKFSF